MTSPPAAVEGPPSGPASGAALRVLRHSGWLAGAYVVAFGLALLQNVVLARNMDPAAFGVLALVIAIVTFVQLLLGSRVWEAATAFVVEFRSKGDGGRATATVKLCYLVDTIGALIGFVLIVSLAQPIARIFSIEGAVAPIRLFALSLLFAVPVATSSALLRIGDRFRWLAAQTVAENMVRLVAVVLVIFGIGVRLMPIVGAYLVAVGVSAVTLGWLASRVSRELGLVRWREAPLSLLAEDRRRILGFLLNSNLAGTARLITGRLDVLIVGWLTDPASVGVYRLARSVSDPLAAFATPVSQAVFPEISKLVHARDLRAIRSVTHLMKKIAAFVVLPVCVVTVLLAGWLVPAVFGASYDEAVPLVRIMVWQLVWIPYLWLPGLLLSLGRAGAVAMFTAIDAAAYLVLLMVLIPPFGVTGAAWATLLRFGLWTGAAAVIARRVDADLRTRWS
jgi:O-antigen/teichoic acid export membrane protein